MKKRIAIISDSHGRLKQEIINVLKTCDYIFHAGDLDRSDILETLQQLGAAIYVVRGNCDDFRGAERLGRSLSFKVEGISFFMAHMSRDIAWDLGDAQVVIFGHTHSYYEEIIDGRLWLNPGSCGAPRYQHELTMILMTVENGKYEIEKLSFPC